MKLKLNPGELDLLWEFMKSDAWKTLIKITDHLCEDIDQRVLQYDLNQGADGLVREKARSEGARKLQLAITKLKEDMKKKGTEKA